MLNITRVQSFTSSVRRVRLAFNREMCKIAKQKPEVDGKYTNTVYLPKTSFDQRAHAVTREPEIQKWWKENKIYEKLAEKNQGPPFVLHDGPPYANGDLHIGHALNKILKDIVNRFNILCGRQVRYVPGWDCHGLPIELKVLQSMKGSERQGLTPLELRNRAAAFAAETMMKQRESFQRYGVWADWDEPYLTMQPAYEAAQLRVFGKMFETGHIYRGKKPVHWSPSSRTALAEAELEYPDNHVSRSIYASFQVDTVSTDFSSILTKNCISPTDVRVVVWTTTAWTIPANLAVAVNGAMDYCLVSHPDVQNGSPLLIAKDLLPTLNKKWLSPPTNGNETVTDVVAEMNVLASFPGTAVVGTTYRHPLLSRSSPIVLGGDYINAESGTGLVHTAPGHGVDDYFTGMKYGLPLLSPVDDAGKFTAEAGDQFLGLDVLSTGTEAVIKALREKGSLICEEAYPHKYPYDWRTKKPTIFRATEQWFASISNYREEAMNQADQVNWIPSSGKTRMMTMLKSRGDWCISRQRSWGVPIPVFYDKTDGSALMTKETIEHIANVFSNNPTGSNAWWELPVKDLLPPGSPLRDRADEFEKGMDTMDVWFDSGTSWAGVLKSRLPDYVTDPQQKLQQPLADLYLEGIDQHRGWFQSSLLTSVAAEGIAPYRTVLTHGFVLDEKGHKMSKSLGNVIDPRIVIEGGPNQKVKPPYGADILRLWVAGVDYSTDVLVGDNVLKAVAENYRKMRNTLRFLLGSLSDFDPTANSVDTKDFSDIDRYMMACLSETTLEVEKAYKDYQFSHVVAIVMKFIVHDLSAFYLDLAKDRLYISQLNHARRRSCQTVLHLIMEQLSVLIAPIVPHLAEDVWQNLPYNKLTLSVFQRGWIGAEKQIVQNDVKNVENWNRLRKLREDVNKCIEGARNDKLIRTNQQTRVVICLNQENDNDFNELLKKYQGDESFLTNPVRSNGIDDLRILFICSQVELVNSTEELEAMKPIRLVDKSSSAGGCHVGVLNAKGHRCERCWFYSADVGNDSQYNDLCSRCADIVRSK